MFGKGGIPDNRPGPGRPKGSINRATIFKGWAEKKGIPFLRSVAEGTHPDYKKFPKVRADVAMWLVEQELGKAPQAVGIEAGDAAITVNVVSYK